MCGLTGIVCVVAGGNYTKCVLAVRPGACNIAFLYGNLLVIVLTVLPH